MQIRELERKDVELLRTILVATNVFRDEEIEVAVELMEATLGRTEDYIQRTIVDDGGNNQEVKHIIQTHTILNIHLNEKCWVYYLIFQ